MKPNDRVQLTQRRRGAIGLITLIFIMFVMIGLVAISVDVGYVMVTRTQLQAAADSATLSGGTEVFSGLELCHGSADTGQCGSRGRSAGRRAERNRRGFDGNLGALS